MNILNFILLILTAQAVSIVEMPAVIPEGMPQMQNDSMNAITSVTLPIYELNRSSEIDNNLDSIFIGLADALASSNYYAYVGHINATDINIPKSSDIGCYSIEIGQQEKVEHPCRFISIYDINFWDLIDKHPKDTFIGVIPIVIQHHEWAYKPPITVYFLIRDTTTDKNIVDSLFIKTPDSIRFIRKEWRLSSKYLILTTAGNFYLGGISDNELVTQFYQNNGKIIKNLHPQFGPIVE